MLGAVGRHTDSLEAEIRLAHYVDVRNSFERQLAEQQKTGECISSIEVREFRAPPMRPAAFIQ